MKTIRVKFVDYWCEDHPQDDNLYRILSTKYNVELSDTPDYVFTQRFGNQHYYYEDAIRIEKVGENIVPEFNACDYAIGCDFLTFGDRYLRVPMCAFNPVYKQMYDYEPIKPEQALNRDFCSFVVSNGNSPLRVEFFHKLSEYKKVASGGRYLNNIGKPNGVEDKLDFISKYKFNISFENTSSDGYVTEKIMQALSVQSVPIYWGSASIDQDFNPQCFVHVKDKDDMERAIEEIIYLDTHDDAYLQKCLAPRLIEERQKQYDQIILDFLTTIIEQPKEQARRLNYKGFQPSLREKMRRYDRLDHKRAFPLDLARKILKK